jgi:hypothetical protein
MLNVTTPASTVSLLGGVFVAITMPSLLSDAGGNPWSGLGGGGTTVLLSS